MDEVWTVLFEFPGYRISTLGQIINIRNDRLVRPSLTKDGTLKVNLYDQGIPKTRSVKVLVADAFIQRPRGHRFNTPIHKDGDHLNVRVDNLLWRPRPFAWKYHEQFNDIPERHTKRLSVVEVTEGIHYECVYDAAVDNGLLFRDIWKSSALYNLNDEYPTTFPTGQVFNIRLKMPAFRSGIPTLSQQGRNM